MLSPTATALQEMKPFRNTHISIVGLSFSRCCSEYLPPFCSCNSGFLLSLKPEVPAIRLCRWVLSASSNATLDDILQGELDNAKVNSLQTFHTCEELIYFTNCLVLLSMFSLFTCIIFLYLISVCLLLPRFYLLIRLSGICIAFK
jgi:hypothetical protein